MIKDFDGLISSLEEIAPVFATDIRKDEVKENEAFFIYDDDGDVKKADASDQYQQEFNLYFVSRNKTRLDKMEIIQLCYSHRLLFSQCISQLGKIEDLDVEASMTSFTFYQIHRICRG